MVVERAAVLTHHPTPAPLARERRSRHGVREHAGRIGGVERCLVGHREQVGLWIEGAAATKVFAKESRVAQAISNVGKFDLAEEVKDSGRMFRRQSVACGAISVAAIAQPCALVTRIIVLSRPLLSMADIRWAK